VTFRQKNTGEADLVVEVNGIGCPLTVKEGLGSRLASVEQPLASLPRRRAVASLSVCHGAAVFWSLPLLLCRVISAREGQAVLSMSKFSEQIQIRFSPFTMPRADFFLNIPF
jgi:hypothetical protein